MACGPASCPFLVTPPELRPMQIPPKTAPRLFLIDGYALIYRSFFAFINRPLINSRGENTSASWGFVNFLLRIRDEYEPDYLAVVFDSGMSQREELYPEYKATREKMPEELAASLPRIRQLVEAFRDPVVELDGYEADDVIGTLARKAREAGVEAVVVSGDKDFHQLIGDGVHLLNPGRGGANGVAAEWVDERNATERLGVAPTQVVDYLALIGDSSDNVPGAPGIGPKTAVKLLEEYGSLDAISSAGTRFAESAPAPPCRSTMSRSCSRAVWSPSWMTCRWIWIWRPGGYRIRMWGDFGSFWWSWSSAPSWSDSPGMATRRRRRMVERPTTGLSPTPERWRTWWRGSGRRGW